MKDWVDTALEMAVFSHPWNEEMVSSSIQGHTIMSRSLRLEGETLLISYIWRCVTVQICFRVAVDAGSRRRGIGCVLMEAMIDDCKDRNVQSIFLEVRESNAAAIAMYEQFGFIKISTRKKYYDSPVEDGLVMKKQL
ncbi:MAG: ribosomal protein S18-alanine N-acetyltransferase [Coprococcus sp.]